MKTIFGILTVFLYAASIPFRLVGVLVIFSTHDLRSMGERLDARREALEVLKTPWVK